MYDIEKKQHTEHSPCPVDSNETLLRAVFFPDHVNTNNTLKPEAIPTQDLKERGFSVQRSNYLRKQTFEKFVDDYVNRKAGRELRGIASILCEKIRAIKDHNSDQAFIVLDDALIPEDEAHAIIKFANSQSRSKGKGLRKKLLDEFDNEVSKEVSFIL